MIPLHAREMLLPDSATVRGPLVELPEQEEHHQHGEEEDHHHGEEEDDGDDVKVMKVTVLSRICQCP